MARLLQKPYVRETVIAIVVFIMLLFTATNVNANLGQIYLKFTIGVLILLIIQNDKLDITFMKKSGRFFQSLLQGFGGWVILLIISSLVTGIGVFAVINIIGAATPILAKSQIANFIVFAALIPFAETQLWARMLEFFGDVLKIRIDKQALRKPSFWILVGILSLAFMAFHLTAKGVASTAILVVVFIMMVISLAMIAFYGETIQANILHWIANGTAAYLLIFVGGGVI